MLLGTRCRFQTTLRYRVPTTFHHTTFPLCPERGPLEKFRWRSPFCRKLTRRHLLCRFLSCLDKLFVFTPVWVPYNIWTQNRCDVAVSVRLWFRIRLSRFCFSIFFCRLALYGSKNIPSNKAFAFIVASSYAKRCELRNHRVEDLTHNIATTPTTSRRNRIFSLPSSLITVPIILYYQVVQTLSFFIILITHLLLLFILVYFSLDHRVILIIIYLFVPLYLATACSWPTLLLT